MEEPCINVLDSILFSRCSDMEISFQDLDLPEEERKRCTEYLKEHGYIDSKEGFFHITEKGVIELEGSLNSLILSGKVVSGVGEGSYYVSREGYIEQLKEMFDIDPFRGTLNVELDPGSRSRWEKLQKKKGLKIDGFREEGEDFVGLKVFPSQVCGLKSLLVLPKKTVHDRTAEIISGYHIKEKLDIKDGDKVVVLVKQDD